MNRQAVSPVTEILKLLPSLGRTLATPPTYRLPREVRGLPITVSEVRLVIHLAEYGPQTMGQIAEGLGITTPSATGLVDRLEQHGLAERRRDAKDRRVVRVQLTPVAQKLAELVLAEWRRRIEAVLAEMTPEEQAALVKGLQRMVQVFEAEAERQQQAA